MIIIIIVLAILGVVVYQNFIVSKNNKKMESSTVRRGRIEEELTISGTIDADEKVTLRFKTSGRMIWVGVKEGDYVKKYQAIASLDQREVKKQLQKELNDYMNERRDFDQSKDDNYGERNEKFITNKIRRILEKDQSDLNNSILDVEIQNLSLEYSNLWTPIEGIITKITSPYAGVNITAAQAEFEIVNPQTVFFSALADQTEVTKIREGQSGELTLDAYSDATISGIVKNISFIPKSGETGTVYQVKFSVGDDNTSGKYRIGMAGDLSFVVKSKDDVLYLPVKFVNSDQGKKYVKKQKNGKTEKAYILTGMETDEEIEIVNGLEEGEVVYK